MEEGHFYDKEKMGAPEHYYGDIIRALFIAAGTLMILALPFFKDQIAVIVSPLAAIFSILVLALLAGFMSPRQKWVLIVDAVFSLFAVLIFEYYAILSYKSISQVFTDPFFLLNQVLACIFFITLYLSVKTVRSAYFD